MMLLSVAVIAVPILSRKEQLVKITFLAEKTSTTMALVSLRDFPEIAELRNVQL